MKKSARRAGLLALWLADLQGTWMGQMGPPSDRVRVEPVDLSQ